jgi:hypothetical protein|tara:strand:+ start:4121 stop:4537 length:417 start_codon:yes stop_codon:yes gene_type:complete
MYIKNKTILFNYMSITKAFNGHFIEFISDVHTILPNDKNIKTAKFYIDTVVKINPTLLVKSWKEHVTIRYDKEIESGDFSFFLKKDYKDDLTGVEETNKVVDAIELIKTQAQNFSDANKKKITKYLQNLTKLSKLYNP